MELYCIALNDPYYDNALYTHVLNELFCTHLQSWLSKNKEQKRQYLEHEPCPLTSAAGTCGAQAECVGVLYLGQGEGQWQQKVERVRVSVALDDAQWHHHVFVEHHETAESRAHQQTVVLCAHARHLTLRR